MSSLIFNYFDNFELFKMLNNRTKLYFTLINNDYYLSFKIKKIILEENNIEDYHIYVTDLIVRNAVYLKHNINLKNLIIKHQERNYEYLKNLNLVKLQLCHPGLSIPLEFMTNLKIVNLFTYKKEDLKVLQNLNIDELYITTCIKDIDELNISGLKIFKGLNCPKNIEKMNLVKLIIEGPEISNLSQTGTLRDLKIRYCSKGPLLLPTEKLVKLKLFNHEVKTNLNNITTLKSLDTTWYYNTNESPLWDDNIKNLNLVKLCVYNCRNIENINHMNNLKILNCAEQCSIQEENIKNLNLIKLDIYNNPNFKNINNHKNLKILRANYLTEISDINNLKLITLDINNNQKIDDLNHIQTLKKINVAYTGVNNKGISKLNLYEVDTVGNRHIYDVTHMTNLKKIYYTYPVKTNSYTIRNYKNC